MTEDKPPGSAEEFRANQGTSGIQFRPPESSERQPHRRASSEPIPDTEPAVEPQARSDNRHSMDDIVKPLFSTRGQPGTSRTPLPSPLHHVNDSSYQASLSSPSQNSHGKVWSVPRTPVNSDTDINHSGRELEQPPPPRKDSLNQGKAAHQPRYLKKSKPERILGEKPDQIFKLDQEQLRRQHRMKFTKDFEDPVHQSSMKTRPQGQLSTSTPEMNATTNHDAVLANSQLDPSGPPPSSPLPATPIGNFYNRTDSSLTVSRNALSDHKPTTTSVGPQKRWFLVEVHLGSDEPIWINQTKQVQSFPVNLTMNVVHIEASDELRKAILHHLMAAAASSGSWIVTSVQVLEVEVVWQNSSLISTRWDAETQAGVRQYLNIRPVDGLKVKVKLEPDPPRRNPSSSLGKSPPDHSFQPANPVASLKRRDAFSAGSDSTSETRGLLSTKLGKYRGKRKDHDVN